METDQNISIVLLMMTGLYIFFRNFNSVLLILIFLRAVWAYYDANQGSDPHKKTATIKKKKMVSTTLT